MRAAGLMLGWMALAVVMSEPVWAGAPMVGTQAPGFYRMKLGEFELTVLNDAVVRYSVAQVLPTATPEQIKRGLAENGLSDPVGMSYNALLINTGKKLILIDTGTGGKLQERAEFHGAGRLMGNLRASGYSPEDVDEIYITHRGQDHVGGLTTAGGDRAFPNATVHAPRSEFEMFLDPGKSAALLAAAHNVQGLKAFVEFTQALFEPYMRAGKYQSFAGDIVLEPGIRALETHGHTPGHTSYVVESRGEKLIVMGDVVLMGALQFWDPSLGSPFDADAKGAAEQRLRVLKMAAEGDVWVMGCHLSFPGIGHVRSAQGGHFVWVPVSYSIPQ